VLVAPLQGPEEVTQDEPLPQNTLGELQAEPLTVLQAPVVGLMQQPVACALAG
jgi:hypothetical protein